MSINLLLILLLLLAVVLGSLLFAYVFRSTALEILSDCCPMLSPPKAVAQGPGKVSVGEAGPGVECPICYNRFSEVAGLVPKVFPCGHTACESCVARLAKNGGVSACPLCRLPATQGQVKTNFALCEALGSLERGDGARGELLKYSRVAAAAGHWSKTHVLGVGGSATVYSADLAPFGRVAVKRFQKGAGAAAGRGFQRELDALCQHRHPHVLEIIGSSAEGPENLIIMPLMEGGTLAQALPQMRWAARAVVVGQLVRALAFIHGKGVLHRDVKSSNVLLDRSLQHSRLADFGLARPQLGPSERSTTGVVIGSPGYMAPELMVRPASEKADAFALGIIFLEVLTGMAPWAPDNEIRNSEECLSLADRVVPGGQFQQRRLDTAAGWPAQEVEVVAEQAIALTLFDPARRRSTEVVEADPRYRQHCERAGKHLCTSSGAVEEQKPTSLGKQAS